MQKRGFYTSVCQQCFRASNVEKLKRCSQCKIMPYCSKEHQQLDWPFHKRLCKAIRLSNEKIPYNVCSHSEFRNYRVALKIAWEFTLRRPLDSYENTVYLHYRVCEVCFKKNDLLHCKGCYCVMYCHPEHQISDEGRHKQFCDQMKICRELDIYQGALDVYEMDLTSGDLPENMEDFVNRAKYDNHLEKYLAAQKLSPCGTILFTLKTLKLRPSHLNAHIVGANMEEMKYNWQLTARILSHFFPIKQFTLTFIGPQLEELPTQEYSGLRLHYYRELYHDVVDRLEPPHLVVAFHCGLHECYGHKQDTWKRSINRLVQPNAPLVITGYLLNEIKKDKELLVRNIQLSLDFVIDCIKNPFASLKPFLNWDSEHEPLFYTNNYISICQKI